METITWIDLAQEAFDIQLLDAENITTHTHTHIHTSLFTMTAPRSRWSAAVLLAFATAVPTFVGRPRQVRNVEVLCEARRVVRCPSCGQAQRADCDGNGRLLGGIAQVAEWSPVKAYSVCPRFRGGTSAEARNLTICLMAMWPAKSGTGCWKRQPLGGR